MSVDLCRSMITCKSLWASFIGSIGVSTISASAVGTFSSIPMRCVLEMASAVVEDIEADMPAEFLILLLRHRAIDALASTMVACTKLLVLPHSPFTAAHTTDHGYRSRSSQRILT